MCKGSEASSLPAWELTDHGKMWRVALEIASGPPEVELSHDALRLRFSPGAEAVVVPLPAHALPIDPELARCTFSRKAGKLLIEWPRVVEASCEQAAAAEESCETVQEAETSERTLPAETEDAQPDEQCTRTAEEWRAEGNDAVKAGNLEEAVRCYSAGLAAGGGDVSLLRSNRSLCLHRLGREEEAVEDARRCVALRPDFVKGYLRGAVALKALGQFEEALAFLRRCPPNDEASQLVSELKPVAEAAEKERIAALAGPERCKEEGNVLFRKGLFEAALEKYSEALKVCEDQEGALALALRNNRAACYHQLSDFENVVKDSSFVLGLETTNLKALVRRMLAYEPLEKYEKALNDARAVLQQDPRHPLANKVQHRLSNLVRDIHRSGGA